MSELLIPKGEIPTSKVLETCQAIWLPSGDILYVSQEYSGDEGQPYELLLSQGAAEMIHCSNLTDILDLPQSKPSDRVIYGYRTFVTREALQSPTGNVSIAVKRIFEGATDITGTEQFEAMRILQENGVLVTNPLAAQRNRFVANWVDGTNAADSSGGIVKFLQYCAELADLVNSLLNQELWKPNWKVDHSAGNAIINDLEHPEILRRFTTFDPVYDGNSSSWRRKYNSLVSI